MYLYIDLANGVATTVPFDMTGRTVGTVTLPPSFPLGILVAQLQALRGVPNAENVVVVLNFTSGNRGRVGGSSRGRL